jgi:hypothetical protein
MILMSHSIEGKPEFYAINPEHVVNCFLSYGDGINRIEGTDRATIEISLHVNLTNGSTYNLRKLSIIKSFLHGLLRRNENYEAGAEEIKIEKGVQEYLNYAKTRVSEQYPEKQIEIDGVFFEG